MNDNEAAVRIVADASGVKPGVDQAKNEVGQLAPALAQLSTSMQDVASSMRAGFAEVEQQLAGTRNEMARVEEETKKEGLSLRELGAQAKEMAVQVHEGVESFNGFKAGLGELAEVYMAAFAVERIADWAKEFAEAKEQVAHLAQTFGMTTQQVQQLGGIATVTGISLETITRGMQVMDRNAIQAAQGGSAMANAFKAVGISADDGRSQMERLEAVADKFKDMDDGPKKAALAMELFGRSGAQLIPILNLGADGLKEMADKAKDFDVANTEVSDSAQAKGEALAESINTSKLAFQGVTNVLGDAFAPILTEITDSMNSLIKAFIDSYNEGGTVAAIFYVIKVVIEEVGAVINLLVGIFKALWDAVVDILTALVTDIMDVFGVKTPNGTKAAEAAINLFKDAFNITKDTIVLAVLVLKAAIVGLIDICVMLGKIAWDAFTMNWGAIEGDWQQGVANLKKHALSTANEIKSTYEDLAATIAAAMKGEGPPKSGEGGTKTGAGGSFDPELGKTPKGKKDDLIQQLDEELKAKETAWAMQQDAQGTAQAYSVQSIADYWKAVLDRDDLSQKDRLAAEQKFLAARNQITRLHWATEEDDYRASLETAQRNEDAKLVLVRAHTAEVLRMFGAESSEYAKAKQEEVAQQRKATEEMEAIDKAHAEARAARLEANLDDVRKLHEFRVAMGLETSAQLIAEERRLADQRFDIQWAELKREYDAAQAVGNDKQAGVVHDRMLAARRAYQAQLTQIDQQAQLQRTAIERTAINSTASLWGQNIAKLVTLQQGFAATLHSLYTGMVDVISGALGKVIENWLAQQLSALLLHKAAQSADGAATVASNAGIAASAAFASTAAIPIVGPGLAPAAASAALSATMAFGSIASAAGGDWNVSEGLYHLHEQEMVLPAWAAQPLRSMLGGGAANGNAPAAANDGASDFHYHDHTGTMGPAQIEANYAAVGRAVKKAHRQGHFTGTRLNF